MSSKVIAAGKVVGIYYTLKNSAGEVVDTNRRGGRPLAFLHGAGNILPALENALVGKQKDERVLVELEPKEGYGERDEQAVKKVPRSSLPPEPAVTPGLRYTAEGPEGSRIVVRVAAVEGDEVTLDHNHPLAGERLFFDVLVAGVRDATDEERQHGHPHGPGGHAH
jgi:FKBP-type peptidyl-prolyl cis-trans isomerase SlyD